MLYEDPAYAKVVRYRFVKNGLMDDQPCILFTHGDIAPIRDEMKRFEIDVSRYERSGMLNILQIRCPTKHAKGFQAGVDRIIETFQSTGITPPHRITGCGFIRDLSTREGLRAQAQVEQMWDRASVGKEESFGQLGEGLILCTHFLRELNPSRRLEWVEEAFALHDGLIYVPQRFGAGVASHL